MRKALLSLTIACTLSMAYAAAPPTSTTVHKAPEGEWTPIGTGVYSDNLFNSFGYGSATWEVDIEQSATDPAWYRMAPFNASATTAIAVGGRADPTSYMYIDTTDPNNVKFDDFTCYKNVVFTQKHTQKYGTLVDGVITFPQNSIVMEWQGKTFYANAKGPVIIYLPGAERKDYSMLIAHDFYCTADNKHELTFTTGADIATIKLMTIAGVYRVSDNSNNASAIATRGTAYTPTNGSLVVNIDASTFSPGVYSAMVVGLDEAGSVQVAKEVNLIVADAAPEGWKELGTTTYNEMLFAGTYQGEDSPEAIPTTVMESTTTPGRYYLVTPYANYRFAPGSAPTDAHGHVHGIIINATNPAQVYVEATPIGYVTAKFGDCAVFSLAGISLGNRVTAEQVAAQGYFGTATKNDDGTTTIKMPAKTVALAQKTFSNGQFTPSRLPLEIIIPADKTSSISSVVAEQSTEAYDLQGRRIVRPAHGLYIQGGRKLIR